MPEEAFEGEIQIPGSKRVNSPIASFELLSQVRSEIWRWLFETKHSAVIAILQGSISTRALCTMDDCPSKYVFRSTVGSQMLKRFITVKGTEAEVLADAVRKENMRLEAYRARDKYVDPLSYIPFSPSFKR